MIPIKIDKIELQEPYLIQLKLIGLNNEIITQLETPPEVFITNSQNEIVLPKTFLSLNESGIYTYLWYPPENIEIGKYSITFTVYYNNTYYTGTQYLEIHPQGSLYTYRIQRYYLDLLRTALGDDNPDVNKQRWTDDLLLKYINLSLSKFNNIPPFTNYKLSDTIPTFEEIIVKGAEIYALRALLIVEAGQRFSYDDNGISLDTTHRFDAWQSLLDNMATEYNEQLNLIKLNMRPYARGILSGFSSINFRSLRPYVLVLNQLI